MPLGKLRLGSRKSPSAKVSSQNAGSEAELMASRSTALRLSTTFSGDSGDDLSSTGSPTGGHDGERHRSISAGSSSGSPARRHSSFNDDLSGSDSYGRSQSNRRHTNGSCGSGGRYSSGHDSGRGSKGPLDGDAGQGKRRTSIFGSGKSWEMSRTNGVVLDSPPLAWQGSDLYRCYCRFLVWTLFGFVFACQCHFLSFISVR